MFITRRVLDQYDKEDGDLCDVECVQVIVIRHLVCTKLLHQLYVFVYPSYLDT